MDKRKMDSPKVCRYNKSCFRLNPVHFDDFSHPHCKILRICFFLISFSYPLSFSIVEEIIQKGKNSAGLYDIPSGCPGDKVLQQLKILESKVPRDSVLPNAKTIKLDLNVSISPKLPEKDQSGIPNPSTKIPDDEPPAVTATTSQNNVPGGSQQSSNSNTSTTSNVNKKIESQNKKESKSQPSGSSSTPTVNKRESNLEKKLQQKPEFNELQSSTGTAKDEKVDVNPSSSEREYTDEQLEKLRRRFLPVNVPRGRMAQKLKDSAPYNIFLTTISSAPETHNEPLSVTFQELLDPSLGELESSVQINFMVEIAWLLAQYTFARCNKLPMLILYGDEEAQLRDIQKKKPNVTSIKVNLPGPIGVHHTKMMLFFYKDNSMRVVVSTANLYEDDWHNRVQGLWISDKLPALPEGTSHVSHGESVTGFREDLMRYLIAYDIGKLQPIIARIRRTDFSGVKVFFVFSVPGSHRDSSKGIYYGHPRIGTLLSTHSAPIDDSNPIMLQSSSIGSLGPNANSWLWSEIAASFRRDSAPVGLRRLPQTKLVYPSLNNVLSSHDGIAGGGCLPYDGRTHEKQTWLKQYLYQWKANSRNRNRAMPHIKSYFRYNDRGLYWFILTSANLSRSAWGSYNKGNKSLNPTLRINSYEAGVMLFPRIMIEKDRFPLSVEHQKDSIPIFRLPYDLPPLPYGPHDVPYCAEYLKSHIAKYGATFD